MPTTRLQLSLTSGRVEHIQSGASRRFVSLEGLQDFVARMLTSDVDHTGLGSELVQ